MTSKWIKDFMNSLSDMFKGFPLDENPSDILERVDSLLRRAMHNVDDDTLYEEIKKVIDEN